MSHPQLSMPLQEMPLPEGTRGVAVQAVPEAPVAVTQMRTATRRSMVPLLFAVLIVALLTGGWVLRDAEYTVADQGLGYALGITGGAMMLLLLLYPVRKQARFMRNWGALRYWFRMHMLFGVLGPVAILFHCNFQLGAINSNVALFSMLTVAGSGLIGRYVYTKIHFGLYGHRATLEDLQARSGSIEGDVQGALSQVPGVAQQLQTFHHIAVRPYSGVLAGLRTLMILGFAARRTRHRAVSALTRWMKQEAKSKAGNRAFTTNALLTSANWWRPIFPACAKSPSSAPMSACSRSGMCCTFRCSSCWCSPGSCMCSPCTSTKAVVANAVRHGSGAVLVRPAADAGGGARRRGQDGDTGDARAGHRGTCEIRDRVQEMS